MLRNLVISLGLPLLILIGSDQIIKTIKTKTSIFYFSFHKLTILYFAIMIFVYTCSILTKDKIETILKYNFRDIP